MAGTRHQTADMFAAFASSSGDWNSPLATIEAVMARTFNERAILCATNVEPPAASNSSPHASGRSKITRTHLSQLPGCVLTRLEAKTNQFCSILTPFEGFMKSLFAECITCLFGHRSLV